jgi:hypothetical protein
MTTEERAKEISESFYRPETGYNEEHLYLSAMAMAEWKEKQRELEIYKNALFEEICNGILMCCNKIEGIDLE